MNPTNRTAGRAIEGADPLVDEIRTIRRKISDRFGNDIDRLLEHLKEVERAHHGPMIRPEDVASLPPPSLAGTSGSRSDVADAKS